MRNTSSMVSIGLLALTLAGSVAAQAAPPGDTGSRTGDQTTRSEPLPTLPAEANRPEERRVEPPARAQDDVEAPPAGCRYRGNKLDLIV